MNSISQVSCAMPIRIGIFAEPLGLDRLGLFAHLGPGCGGSGNAGLAQHVVVDDERHEVVVIGDAVLLAFIAHRIDAKLLDVGIVFGQVLILIDRHDPAGLGPFRQPAVRNPERIDRRAANELGDEAFAILRPRRVRVFNRDPGLGLERGEMAFDGIDRGRPGREMNRFLGRGAAVSRKRGCCSKAARRTISETIGG